MNEFDLSKLNKIARVCIECFIDADFDNNYIHGKIADLEQKNEWQTMFWATHQLDQKNRQRFADKLNIVDIHTFMDNIRKIEFEGDL